MYDNVNSKNIAKEGKGYEEKIILVLMCTVMAFAIPISAEGDVELHGSYVWCPNCAGAAKATQDTKSYFDYRPCTQHNFSYGLDYCRFIDTITTVYC